MEPSIVNLLLALAISFASVATLFVSWRRWHGSKRVIVAAGWLLACSSFTLWIRFGGAEFGVAYATIAVAFTAWILVATLGREMRPADERRRQQRIDREALSWSAVWATIGRVFVGLPLAGAASLLASLVLVADLPWTTANRYVSAIVLAPIIWGVLAMWAGMTTRLPRVALVLAGVSVACSAALFVW